MPLIMAPTFLSNTESEMSLSSLMFDISTGALKALIESLREDVGNVISSGAQQRLDLAEAVLIIREKVPGCSVERICHMLADELRSLPDFSVTVSIDKQELVDPRLTAWEDASNLFQPRT